jgi:hypothetical protein
LEIVETPLTGRYGEVSEPCKCLGKEPMLKTILITGTIGMIVGFGGTLMSLFGGGTLLMEYLEFVVMLALFLVMLIGAYWFVAVGTGKDEKKPTP